METIEVICPSTSNTKEFFLVIDTDFKIVRTFEHWGKAIMNYLDNNPAHSYVSTTDAKHAYLLPSINAANNTNF